MSPSQPSRTLIREELSDDNLLKPLKGDRYADVDLEGGIVVPGVVLESTAEPITRPPRKF